MSVAAESAPAKEGDVLAGKYRVERVLGVGGMGVVVAATHLQLDQKVALKFLLPAAMEQPGVVERFAREARAAAKILSEHVARVIDVGTLESGSPYMVMEYLDGHDLAAHLERSGPLPVGDAVAYVLQACEAIAEAHAAGIVHRDLKPANLFLARRPGGASSVKVLDFGISKTATPNARSEAELTKTATLVGSPLYMSPEQLMSSKNVDVRTDIWALGVVLYELVAGRPPFLGDTIAQIVALAMNAPHDPMRMHRLDTPEALDAVVSRCLAKKPEDRFADVAHLAAALAPFAPARAAEVSVERISRVLSSDVSLKPAAAVTTGPSGAGEASAWAGTQAGTIPGAPKRRGLVVAITAVALVGAAIGAYVVFGRSPAASVTSAGASIPPSASPIAPPASPPPALSLAPLPEETPTASATATASAPPAARAKPVATVRASIAATTATTLATTPPPPPPKKDSLHPGLE